MPPFGTHCTTKKQAEFLDFLADTGNVSSAAKSCNIPRRTLYNCRAIDPSFAAAWDEALELGLDALEDEAMRRAREGFDVPVFNGGLRCGVVRKYSDLLLIFLLKSRRPTRYASAVIQESNPAPRRIIDSPSIPQENPRYPQKMPRFSVP